MKKELKKLLQDCIVAFDKESSQTKIFYPELKGKKYFVKVAGQDRARYLVNEIDL